MMSENYWNEYDGINKTVQPADTQQEPQNIQPDHSANREQGDAALNEKHDFSPFASSQPQPSERFTNPYVNAQPKTYYTERSSYDSTRQPAASYGDGFYHKSFSHEADGSNVNYTTPVYRQPAGSERSEKKKEKRSGIGRGGVAILLVVCLLISGAAGFGGSLLASKLNQPEYESTVSDTMVIHKVSTDAQPAGTETLVDKSTSQITTEVADTVVEITTEVVQTNSFYGQYISQGAGSGVIISADGYILTNNHVIEGADSIKVSTRSGEEYDATLVGTDPEVDIALLKIEATNLPVAVIGDSSTLNVGDKAVIIGNPLGTLGGSVTEGIISALDRSIVIDGKTMHLMQTDAAINPGNSGGGMFNGQGELTGIVVAKSSSETIDNIGFVIPINTVLDILSDLKDYGYVRGRADTGMTFIDLTNQMYAWYYFNNDEAGVYISSVESGSNAEKAGFRAGDRVVSVDGHSISQASEIEELISEKSVGDTMTFVLNRSGSKGTLELTLEEYVPETTSSSKTETPDTFGGNGGFGFGR